MPFQKTGQVACHKQVRDVAMATTENWYEALMGASNDIYKEWKRQNPNLNAKDLQKRFVQRFWPRCIEFARATLTIMLTRPDVSDPMKEQIMDVLEKDQFLRQRTGTVLRNQVEPMHTVH